MDRTKSTSSDFRGSPPTKKIRMSNVEATNASTSFKKRKFQVPRPTLNFIGREENLQKLHDLFAEESKIVAIKGMAGVGKTETVKMYTSKYEDEYDSIVWIRSETESALVESFENLAQASSVVVMAKVGDQTIKRNVKFIIQDIYDVFSTSQQKCLFTFDDCESYDKVRQFLPPHNLKNIHVLITSRNTDWPGKELHRIETVSLDVFTPDLAIAYLEKKLKIDYDGNSVQELAKILGYLPLALRHATGYINENNIPNVIEYQIKDYLREFDDGTMRLLTFKTDDYDKTMLTMVEGTFDHLKSKGAVGELAVELMQFMSYCPRKDIQSDCLFSRLRKSTLYKALDLLEQFSLINSRKSVMSYPVQTIKLVNIEGLIQKVVRLNVTDEVKLLRKHLCNLDREKYWEIRKELSIIWGFASKHPSVIDVFDFDCADFGTPLEWLSEIDNVEGVRRILTRIQDRCVNFSEILKEPLINACWKGNLEMLQLLLDRNVDVNFCNEDGNFPLLEASWGGHLEIVRLLLDENADVNFANQDGNTSLIKASEVARREIVQLLLDRNADVNLTNKDGNTALIKLCGNSFGDVFAGLDRNNENKYSNKGDNTSVIKAYHRRREIVQLLVHENADVNLANKDGETPLIIACSKGHTQIVEILLTYGADASLRDRQGNNALDRVDESVVQKLSKMLR